MDVSAIFEVLAKGTFLSETQSEKKDYKERLIGAGKVFDEYKKIQMNTSTFKKVKLLDLKKLAYDIYVAIATFLPYKDLFKFMISNKNVYSTLVVLNAFWEKKFEMEFSGFGYPNSLTVPRMYLFYKELIPVFFQDFPSVPIPKDERKELFIRIDWFRKTKYFLKHVFELNKMYPFKANFSFRNMDRMRRLSENYLVEIGGLSDMVFTIGNESLVVALIVRHNVHYVFPYLENNRNKRVDYKVLLNWVNLRRHGLNVFLRYTKNTNYNFDRRKFILNIIKLDFDVIELSEGYLFIRDDAEIMKILIEKKPRNIAYLTNQTLKNDPDFAWFIVNEDHTLYDYLGPNIKNYDEKIAKYVFYRDGAQLRHAGPLIKDNLPLVEIAVENTLFALSYASDRIVNQPDFMFRVFSKYREYSYPYIGDILRNNPNFVIRVANEISPEIFDDIGEKLKKNKGFCLKMLKITDGKLDYFCKNLRNDKEFVWEAFKINNEVLYVIGPLLQNDPDFLLSLLKEYHHKKKHFNKIWLRGYGAFKNKSFVLEAVKLDGTLIELTDFGGDFDVVKEAIVQNPYTINMVKRELLKENPHLYLYAFKQNPTFFNEFFYFLDKEVIEYVISNEYWELFLRNLSTEKLNFPFVILAALKVDARAMEYASKKLKSDPEFIRLAIKINPNVIISQ